MSHTGGGLAVTNLNLTFDDAAPAGYLPNSSRLTNGTYRPTAYEGPVTLPGNPAPTPYGATLSTLNGIKPNGAWLLYVYDDANGDAGVIADGWRLALTIVPELPVAYDTVLSGSIVNGQFHLTVEAEPGFEYIVQASTNFTSWVSLSTNTNTTGVFTFIDTTTPLLNSRYYRTLRR